MTRQVCFRCLEKNPENRPYMTEIIRHPFLLELPENDYPVIVIVEIALEPFSILEFSIINKITRTNDNEEKVRSFDIRQDFLSLLTLMYL